MAQPPQSAPDDRVRSEDLLARAERLEAGDTSAWQGPYQKTMQLLTEARVALDRGDLPQAEQLARSAQALKVPDDVYQVGDTRPWMVLMEISRSQDRVQSFNPTALASAIEPPPASAVPAASHAAYQQPADATASQVMPAQGDIFES